MMYNRSIKLDPCNEIIDGLFLGDHIASSNSFILKKHGITHVLSVGTGLYPKFPNKFTYKWINELDSPTANLRQHFNACHKFMSSCFEKGGRILVHCYAGISRSATMVISWLMREKGLSLNEAINTTRAKRWFINPNPGFMRQLRAFEKELEMKGNRPAKSIYKLDDGNSMLMGNETND